MRFPARFNLAGRRLRACSTLGMTAAVPPGGRGTGADLTASPLLAMSLEPFLTYWPVLGVGCAVGLVVLTVLSVRRFRAPEKSPLPPAPYLGPEDRMLDSNWQLDP